MFSICVKAGGSRWFVSRNDCGNLRHTFLIEFHYFDVARNDEYDPPFVFIDNWLIFIMVTDGLWSGRATDVPMARARPFKKVIPRVEKTSSILA